MYDTTKPYKGRILDAIRSTWLATKSHVFQHPGLPYPLIRSRHGANLEIDHTDGIGTKGVIHAAYRTWASAAQDALAMNLNDLLCVRATPYKIQNHLSLAHDDHEAIVEIVEALAKLCIQYDIAMTGGETSVMDTVRGMDLSVTVTGFVTDLRGSLLQTGNLLIGLPSNGVHSNGFTLVRKFFDGAALAGFTAPTTIYWDKVFPHLGDIDACMHIAGGGFTRIRDYMQYNQAVEIKGHPGHRIFDKLYKAGVGDLDMYKTFNCGIGMIIAAAPANAERLASVLGGSIIGEVVPGDGKDITVKSTFSGDELHL